MEITDMAGKLCFSSGAVNGENMMTPSPDLPEGFYTLKIIYKARVNI